MNISDYLEKNQEIQTNLLEYLDEEENIEESFQNIIKLLKNLQIFTDPIELKSFLNLLVKISNNHYHSSRFYYKVDQILQNYEKDIKNFYSNYEIFNIFKSNKRILLFLFQNNIITINNSIFNIITSNKYINRHYPQYFSPELKLFMTEEIIQKVKNDENEEVEWIDYVLSNLPENFEKNRLNGENNDDLSKLIQKDSIEDFIIYVNKNSLLVDATIKESIFETNSFLFSKSPLLIEYAAFYGSIQIFRYLLLNDAVLSPSLWLYAVHGNNPEIIHLLQEKNIQTSDGFKGCFIESIKCHNNDVANYIKRFLLKNNDNNNQVDLKICLKYFNYLFVQKNSIDVSYFFYCCKYDHYFLVKFLLNTKWIEINETYVFYLYFCFYTV